MLSSPPTSTQEMDVTEHRQTHTHKWCDKCWNNMKRTKCNSQLHVQTETIPILHFYIIISVCEIRQPSQTFSVHHDPTPLNKKINKLHKKSITIRFLMTFLHILPEKKTLKNISSNTTLTDTKSDTNYATITRHNYQIQNMHINIQY